MNQSTEDIIEIMNLVKGSFVKHPDRLAITNYRLDAKVQIATRRSVNPTTVADAYIRGLLPYVSSTNQFDNLLKDWLCDDSNEIIEIVAKFLSNTENQELVAEFEINKSEAQQLLENETTDSVSQPKYPEGRRKIEIHLSKERNRQLVKDAKHFWISKNGGDVKCSVCGFSFESIYGNLGRGFIEAHHNLAISELQEETIMKIADLSPVCSNCHRIIHRKRPFISIHDLSDIIEKLKNS